MTMMSSYLLVSQKVLMMSSLLGYYILTFCLDMLCKLQRGISKERRRVSGRAFRDVVNLDKYHM